MPGGSWGEPRLPLAGGLLGLGARVGDVGRHQLEAAVLAAVREAPDAVVAERSTLVGDFPVVMRDTGGRGGPWRRGRGGRRGGGRLLGLAGRLRLLGHRRNRRRRLEGRR